jgi:steroid 5-alpha reductase family enzyme
MDIVRYATPEEIEEIKSTSDLTLASNVVTFGGKDFAVIRNVWELDPVIFAPETTDKRKLLFLMNLESALRLQGNREVYFNIHADDERWREVAQHWGAQPTSVKPEIRFKKVL